MREVALIQCANLQALGDPQSLSGMRLEVLSNLRRCSLGLYPWRTVAVRVSALWVPIQEETQRARPASTRERQSSGSFQEPGKSKKRHEVSWTFSPRSYGNARRKSGMPRKQGRSVGTRNSVGLAPTKDQRQNTLTYEPRSTSSPLRLRRHAREGMCTNRSRLSPFPIPTPDGGPEKAM